EIRRIHEGEASHAVDLHDTDRDEGVAIGAREIHVEHHDFAGIGVDQQVADDAQLAAAHGSHFPSADVRIALGNLPGIERAQRNQPFTLFCVGTDAGGVAHVTLFGFHALSPPSDVDHTVPLR